MMYRVLVFILLFFTSINTLAKESSSIDLFTKKHQDIDYRLKTAGVSASLVTPAGLFRCDPGYLTGETRIDSFNDIIGVSDVRHSEWKDFTAHDLECRYGAKWVAAGGTFKAGIGFRDFLGKTADEPGGKRISVEGAGALVDYDSENFDASFEWEQEIHDYKIRHQPAFGSYDSLIDATLDTYTSSGSYGKLYFYAKHLSGDKQNVYTTPLFPANKFRYDYTDYSLGIHLNPAANGLTLIAPIFGEGSYRGSFNPLQGDSGLKGVRMTARVEEFEVDFDLLRHEGEGHNPYLPATERITENKKTTRVSIAVKRDDWNIKLENARSNHIARAVLIHPTYAMITGGYGPYKNKRVEDKWTLTASFPVRKDLTAHFSFYHTSRQDRQYNHPEHDYIEKGGSIQLSFSI
ncbi:MAG: hypothetical protein ABW098_12560 [Candidatus Thiodiazotropha sp.]